MAVNKINEFFETARVQLRKDHDLKVNQLKEEILSIKKKALSSSH